MPDAENSVRVDRWLWAARLYKTRSLAARAVTRGRVMVNGERVKPARGVRVGDTIRVNREGNILELDVSGLAARRGPAAIAGGLYAETDASVARRAREAEQRRLVAPPPAPQRRPDKRDRRMLARIRRGADGDQS